MSVPDGVYPRINAALHSQRKYGESLVSLVGRIVSNDGSNVILECGDGGKVPLTGMDPAEFQQKPGDVIEAIGHATENDANMMVFVWRDLGEDFDLQVYNELITKIQPNPKYSAYFHMNMV